MAQIFRRSTNYVARGSIVVLVVLVSALGFLVLNWNRLDYVSGVHVAREQPVQFSHKHHAGELGIDCRYCHTQVENAAYAGIPPTKTCINCHQQIWLQSPYLEPVRASFRNDEPIEWVKVHDLPDFVYFSHFSHVNKGVGCATCHGRVDKMNQVYEENALNMEWCLNCHRHPERYLRPKDEVFNMAWAPEGDQVELGLELIKANDVHPRTDCSTCHR
jgi:hypothetical protein